MSGFLDLPNELLDEIAFHLDRRDLKSLQLVHSRFWGPVQHWLVRDFSLNVRNIVPAVDYLFKYPGLRARVAYVKIECDVPCDRQLRFGLSDNSLQHTEQAPLGTIDKEEFVSQCIDCAAKWYRANSPIPGINQLAQKLDTLVIEEDSSLATETPTDGLFHSWKEELEVPTYASLFALFLAIFPSLLVFDLSDLFDLEFPVFIAGLMGELDFRPPEFMSHLL